jgi:hypothetical protein
VWWSSSVADLEVSLFLLIVVSINRRTDHLIAGRLERIL